MQLFKTQQFVNPWIKQNRIPLGRLASDTSEIIYKIHSQLADSFLIAARPGVGKSVLMKLIYYFLYLFRRPVIIFDPEGLDHRLSYSPTKDLKNLPPGINPQGLDDIYYYNISSKESMNHEQIYSPNLNDYKYTELMSLGFSPGAAIELKRLLTEYGSFDDFDGLYHFLREFPTNEFAAKVLAKKKYKEIEHHTFYKTGDWILSNTKNSIIVNLTKIMEEKIISLSKDNSIDMQTLLNKGRSMCFSFDGNYDVARVEISKKIGQVIEWARNTDRTKYAMPYLIFEDQDMITPRYLAPGTSAEKQKDIIEKISQLILRCRKLSIGSGYTCPALWNIHPNIIENTNENILGKFRGRHLQQIKDVFGFSVAETVSYLKWDKYKNEREFLYLNEFENRYKILPFSPPMDFHREIQKKKRYEGDLEAEE